MPTQSSTDEKEREVDVQGTGCPDTEKREQRQRNDVDDVYSEIPTGGEFDGRPDHCQDSQAVQDVPTQDTVQYREVITAKWDDNQRDECADRDDGARRCYEPLETDSR